LSIILIELNLFIVDDTTGALLMLSQ